MLTIGDTADIHQYAWINQQRNPLKKTKDAYCIVPSNNYFDAEKFDAPFYNSIKMTNIIERKRGGKLCRRFYVFRVKNIDGR